MDRLTYFHEIHRCGCWEVKGADNKLCREVCNERTDIEGCNDCPISNAINKLAAYENSGLEPEEIADLKKNLKIFIILFFVITIASIIMHLSMN